MIAVKQLIKGREDEREVWSVRGRRDGASLQLKRREKVQIKNLSGVINLLFTI